MSLFEKFNCLKHTNFTFVKLSNSTYNILFNQLFLSISENQNIVDFYSKDDNSGRQHWTIETDSENNFFIKSAFQRKDFLAYLGAPNACRDVYLYTSKNEFTKWKIELPNLLTYTGSTFDPKDIHLVVSVYNEDIQWTLAYSDICVIYNKGPRDLKEYKNVTDLPNIGREGHTYLHHMASSKDKLANWTFFLQAEFLSHNETLYYGIDNYKLFDKNVQPLGLRYLKSKQIPPDSYVQSHETITPYGLHYAVYMVDNSMRNIPAFEDKGLDNLIYLLTKENGDINFFRNFLQKAKFPVKNLPSSIPMTCCGLFALKKEKILCFSPKVYNNLIVELLAQNNQGGCNGYLLERLWLFIFS